MPILTAAYNEYDVNMYSWIYVGLLTGSAIVIKNSDAYL
jgi:hypothetical protein